jgi:hypothetical protein
MVIGEKAGEKPVERTIIPARNYLMKVASHTLHAKPLGVSKT